MYRECSEGSSCKLELSAQLLPRQTCGYSYELHTGEREREMVEEEKKDGGKVGRNRNRGGKREV